MAIKLIEVLKMRVYLLIAVVSALAFTAVYIYTQVLGIVENVDIWLTVIPLHNAVLFAVFAALFGVTLSFQIYNWRQPKVCTVSDKAKSGSVSSGATFVGLLVAQCPACASLGALFLPVSAVTFFTQFSFVINLVSIGLLLFVINYLGGFKRAVKEVRT